MSYIQVKSSHAEIEEPCMLLSRCLCWIHIFIRVLRVPRADHISAQNLKGCNSSSAAPTETIQPTGERQTKPLGFVFLLNKQTSACVYKTFYGNRWK